MKKIFSQIAILCMASMTFFACTKVEEMDNRTNPLPIPHNDEVETVLQGLTISPRTNYVVVGDELTLTATANPANAVLGNLAWTSSNPGVASVDGNGRVKALTTGMALVTAASGNVSVTAIVNVFAERVPATAISLSKTEVTLLVGRATKIRATLLPDGSEEGQPGTTDQLDLVWSSSNENVATVNYGFVQAVGLGEATLTAKQGDLTATVKVTVADKVKLQDRSQTWKLTDTPKWDKDWSGNISGSHEEVALEGFDADLAYFKVVAADKFTDVETVSNDVYMQVEELRDQDKDPKSLFKSGENQKVSYSDLGEAVAFVLGYDSECEFTGEYAIYRFEARTPDPVHATGIQFLQGSWGATVISSLELKEGKATTLQLKFLPEDCTDTGDISLEAADPSLLKVEAYYPEWYSNYYTVTALSAGSTQLIARYGDVESTLEVTVSGSSISFRDRSAEWTITPVKNEGGNYPYSVTLESCSDPYHYMLVENRTADGFDVKATYASFDASYGEWVQYYVSADVPHTSDIWQEGDIMVLVFGFDAGYNFTGNYAVKFFNTANVGGEEPGPGPGPGPEPQQGKLVSLDGQYFPLDWDDMDAVQDEVTLEAWVNSASFSGGKDDIYTVMGTEGIFMLRFEGNKLNLVYGGPKRASGNEYDERKVSYSTAFETNKWYHIAATYSRGGEAILYVNGEKVGSNTAEDHAIELNGVGAEWVLPFKFYVGVSSNKRVFKGSLAYLRVWDYARSAAEIKDNMNVADPADDGYDLLASWHFDEGSGNTIADHGATKDYALTATGDLSWIDGELPF